MSHCHFHTRNSNLLRGEVTFDGVSFTYPTRPDTTILDSMVLRVPEGHIQAVVGASGSGKSTIGSMLLRFYDPTSGAVKLDGIDVRELDPSWLRDQIGIVSQEPVLFSGTIGENIAYSNPQAAHEQVGGISVSPLGANLMASDCRCGQISKRKPVHRGVS